jgi:hypothetical protein
MEETASANSVELNFRSVYGVVSGGEPVRSDGIVMAKSWFKMYVNSQSRPGKRYGIYNPARGAFLGLNKYDFEELE